MIIAVLWPAFWIRFDTLQRWPWVVVASLFVLAILAYTRSRLTFTSCFRVFAVIAMLLAMLEPVIGRPRGVTEAGPIVLLLDVSRSMTTHDRLRTPRQRVALARAMGRLPAEASAPSIDEVRELVNRLAGRADALSLARAELDYARLLGRRSPELRAHFENDISQLRTEALSDVVPARVADDRLGNDVLKLAGPGLAPGLSRDNWLNQLPALIRSTKFDVDRVADEADEVAYRSRGDLRAACDAVNDLSRLELERLAALRVEQSIHTALGAGVPVRAIAFGNGVEPIDLRSADLDALACSSLGQGTQIVVAARRAQMLAEEAPIASVLFSDGRPVGDIADTAVGPTQEGRPVFTVRVAKSGTVQNIAVSNFSSSTWAYRGQKVFARVLVQAAGLRSPKVNLQYMLGRDHSEVSVPISDAVAVVARPSVVAGDAGVQKFSLIAQPTGGEPVEGDSSIHGSIRVIDRTIGVLLLSDAANAPQRSPLESLPFVRLSISKPGEPVTPAAIESADVIVFGSFDAQQLSTAAWSALHDAVMDKGTGLVFSGASADSITNADDSAVTELTPWEPGTSGIQRTETDAELTLQPAGLEVGPLLGPVRLLDQWLPSEPMPASSASVLIDAATRTPVLMEKHVGAGRSLLLTVTPAVATSMEAREILARLWTIIIRNAASPPFSAGSATQKLDVDPPAGDPTTPFHVRLESAASRPVDAIELRREGRVVAKQRVVVTNRTANVVQAATTLTKIPVGHYTVAIAGADSPTVDFDVTQPVSTEMGNLTGRSDVLRRIARQSGGATFELEETHALVDRLRAAALAPQPPVEWHLSAGPQLLGFIVGCLAVDWSLRKRVGLA